MSQFRRNLLLSGLAGLLVCVVIAATCIWLLDSGTLKPLLPYPAVALLFALIFGGFSLAEIPIMVFAMRRLLIERPDNQAVVLGVNLLTVSFAGVYGAPVLLLTGSVDWGLALCSLSVVRFVASLIFVKEAT